MTVSFHPLAQTFQDMQKHLDYYQSAVESGAKSGLMIQKLARLLLDGKTDEFLAFVKVRTSEQQGRRNAKEAKLQSRIGVDEREGEEESRVEETRQDEE